MPNFEVFTTSRKLTVQCVRLYVSSARHVHRVRRFRTTYHFELLSSLCQHRIHSTADVVLARLLFSRRGLFFSPHTRIDIRCLSLSLWCLCCVPAILRCGVGMCHTLIFSTTFFFRLRRTTAADAQRAFCWFVKFKLT